MKVGPSPAKSARPGGHHRVVNGKYVLTVDTERRQAKAGGAAGHRTAARHHGGGRLDCVQVVLADSNKGQAPSAGQVEELPCTTRIDSAITKEGDGHGFSPR